ncbi:MAG TPA: hypothetical protein VGV93_07435 [Acidimicrobiales bacterium]|nr:hypothetical protein [Acidimicrobiales bacterium]
MKVRFNKSHARQSEPQEKARRAETTKLTLRPRDGDRPHATSSRRRVRVLAVGAVTALSIVGLGPPASPAPGGGQRVERGDSRVVRGEFDHLSVVCAASTNQGIIHLMVGGSEARHVVGLDVWGPNDDVELVPPRLRTEIDDPRIDVVFDGARLQANAPLLDRQGEDAAHAAIVLHLDFGEPQTDRNTTHMGNRTSHLTQTVRAVSAEGSLEISDGRKFELSACQGSHVQEAVKESNPRSLIIRGTAESLRCTVTGEAGMLDLWIEGPTIDLYLTAPGETQPWLTGIAHQHDSWGLAEGYVFRDDMHITERTGSVLGDGQLQLWVEPTGRTFSSTLRFTRGAVRTRTTEIVATAGSVILPIENGEFDLSGCIGYLFDTQGHVTDPARQPTGPVPVNDEPASATPVALGRGVTQQTGGAAVEVEVVPSCMFDPASEEVIPSGHSVWFSFEGTGAPVTVDTAGSLFDTVVTVYARNGERLVELGCASETGTFPEESFQAAVTVDTEQGSTYLVQVGGFMYDYGVLKLKLTP